MTQELPRIINGFRTEVFFRVAGLFAIFLVTMLICGHRSSGPREDDAVQLGLKGAMLVSGLLSLASLPYYFIVFMPQCDSCKVRTKKHGKLLLQGEEWMVVICPCCRERMRFRALGSDPT